MPFSEKAHNNITHSPLREYRLAKRASSRCSRSRFFRAAMTVEAAIVLPLFLFFFGNILYIFEMIRLQSCLLAALHETGTQISEYAYFYRYGLDDLSGLVGTDGASPGEASPAASRVSSGGDDVLSFLSSYAVSLITSELYVRNQVNHYLGETYLKETCLEGGSAGISYLRSRILTAGSRDIVDLVADYRVRPFIEVMAPSGFSMQCRYYGHAWVGYDNGVSPEDEEEEAEEDIVYITPTGTVYHLTRECTYLKPSVHAISSSDIGSARNNSGGKYYPCERCRPSRSGTLFITNDGNRYHSSSTCSSIYHNILSVPLSSVEDHMRACSKCGR